MRQSRERHLLYIGIILAVLPVMLLRDFTPSNELRYLSIADEALRNHALFAFTCHGTPYADKPPLYLWIVMFCRWLTGSHQMWLLSLFSLVPALWIVKTMDAWTKEEMDAQSHDMARLMTITSGLFLVSALTIRMDMLMCMFIVLALREVWIMYTMGVDKKIPFVHHLLLALYVFLAVFSKGPLGFLIPLLSSAVYIFFFNSYSRKDRCRLFARIWDWRTWLILVVLCALWFGAVYNEGGPEYLHNLLFHQTFGRAVHAFHHSNPFYYYAIAIWYCLAPWSPLVIIVFLLALKRSVVKSDMQRFFLIISTVIFILLSCISAKLEIYFLPALPFTVYSAAMFLPRFIKSMPRTYKMIRGIAVGLLVVVFIGGWTLPWVNPYIGYDKLCDEALEISAEYGITEFHAWHVKHSENMDVYLHRAVMKIPDDSIPSKTTGRPYIMLTKKKYLNHFEGLKSQVVGDNAIIVCPVSRQ